MTTSTPTLTTSLDTTSGYVFVTGWRESAWATARFDIQPVDSNADPLPLNLSWTAAWDYLTSVGVPARNVEATLRSVLPPA